ncbi:MAG: HAD family hydrolase [Nannocystaceae bacterium]
MFTPKDFKTITFDCYGTLIDWETGILAGVIPMLARHGISLPATEILRAYARAESAVEAGPDVLYREVLRRTLVGMSVDLGFAPSSADCEVLARALPSWAPFSDTCGVLRRLTGRYRLGLISNIDEDLLYTTRRALGVEFDLVVTAERARAYKPAIRPFEMALAEMGGSSAQWLHVAQSRFHDIEPALRMGLSCVHVQRSSGGESGRVVPECTAEATRSVDTLAELADLLGV